MELKDLEKNINETLELLILPSGSLYEAARYSLFNGGKRIRPLLTLLTAQMLGCPLERALKPACALEMIHTYSLIHDDLPCMDDDDYRRGQPTLHRVYTEGHAVLTGDFLLTFAFETLAKAPLLSAGQKIELITLLSEASGGEGMVGGQVLDLAGSAEIEELHMKKTGALFLAAVQMGGVIAEATNEQKKQLEAFGRAFGLFFQAIDDIHDGDSPLGVVEGFKRAEVLHAEVLALLPSGSPFHPLIERLASVLADRSLAL